MGFMSFLIKFVRPNKMIFNVSSSYTCRELESLKLFNLVNCFKVTAGGGGGGGGTTIYLMILSFLIIVKLNEQ